jgi:hypothetical protein
MRRLLGPGEKGWDEFAGGRVGGFLRLYFGRGLTPVALRRRAADTLEKVTIFCPNFAQNLLVVPWLALKSYRYLYYSYVTEHTPKLVRRRFLKKKTKCECTGTGTYQVMDYGRIF